MTRLVRSPFRHLVWLLPILVAAFVAPAPEPTEAPAALTPASADLVQGRADEAQILRGRQLVINRGCGDCHGGFPNPASTEWLVGNTGEAPTDTTGGFKQWAPNLTPDTETGTGRYSDRQLFNALRYGLRPSTTPDVAITSAVAGQGNHPARPDYLGPAMPWVYLRYLDDQELRDIVAYLKHGVAPVRSAVRKSEAPPDKWVGFYAGAQIGGPDLPPFPTAAEELTAPDRRAQVMRGRHLAASMACSACHGGAIHPGQPGWLSGLTPARPDLEFQMGPFKTRPRNLTPHNTTGMGRFTERQIFNAMRFGLRPGETPDVEITSTVAGQGNHPANPKYLAPPMPWPAWRHLSDADIRALAAYLKHGVKPVANRVADSEGPPDFWASAYTPEAIGTWPAAAFPTARERRPGGRQ